MFTGSFNFTFKITLGHTQISVPKIGISLSEVVCNPGQRAVLSADTEWV